MTKRAKVEFRNLNTAMCSLIQGRLSLKNSAGAKGELIFGVQFYAIFGRFGKMTHLVNLKKCRAQASAAQACAPPLA